MVGRRGGREAGRRGGREAGRRGGAEAGRQGGVVVQNPKGSNMNRDGVTHSNSTPNGVEYRNDGFLFIFDSFGINLPMTTNYNQ